MQPNACFRVGHHIPAVLMMVAVVLVPKMMADSSGPTSDDRANLSV